MATPIISEAIVKLSNEKIRKYHLSRLLRNSTRLPQRPISFSPPSPPFTPLSFHPLYPSPSSVRFHDDGWNNHEAFGRLPAVTRDGTVGRLVKWFEVSEEGEGRDKGWEGGKNGQSFVRSVPALATKLRENFQINEDIPFEIMLRHQRRSLRRPLCSSATSFSLSRGSYHFS